MTKNVEERQYRDGKRVCLPMLENKALLKVLKKVNGDSPKLTRETVKLLYRKYSVSMIK